MIDPQSIPVRFTHLKQMAKSPLHYHHAINEERADSTAMRMGRLVHTNVLGGMPDDEDGRVVIYDGERRGNAWKEFAADHPEDEIVTAKEWEKSLPIADAVRADRHAAKLLEGATFEQSIAWKIGERACRSRPDIIRPGESIVDLKTTTDASLSGFTRQAWKMCYHAQLAYYFDAARSIGIEVHEALLIAVEVRAPHPVTVFRLTPKMLEEGRRFYRSWFERLLVCEENEYWPAYTEHVESFDVPEWHETESDEEAEEAAA